MSIDLFIANLTSPAVLFFFLGMAAVIARSDLEVPHPLPKLFSIYLLWAIGIKGGVALREAGLNLEILTPVLAAIVISAIIPVVLMPILKRFLPLDDSCAVAACYGSVSVVTFLTALDFLESQGIEYGGEMVAALALMESPPIIVALIMRRLMRTDDGPRRKIGELFHESVTSGPVFLLLGSLVAGVLMGPQNFEPLRAFTYDIFNGVLVLFLLEAGMTASKRLSELRAVGVAALVCAIVIPICTAALGIVVAHVLGMPVGNALLFTILSASASYIAVPAVMRLALPEANSGVYLPMSLAISFPFNVCVGIPLYLTIITSLWG
ncbi:MAG: sodium-dependent bicarbonate transport family permease [Phycisphaerales bacterium JB043]